FDARKQSHFAEHGARLELTYLFLSGGVANVNIERALDGDVERVPAPFTLAHDLFACIVSEKTDVRSDALTIRVIAPLNYDFEIGGVLLFAILFLEKFSGKSKMLDGFNNATPIGNFAWHVIVYTTVVVEGLEFCSLFFVLGASSVHQELKYKVQRTKHQVHATLAKQCFQNI